MCPGAAGFQWFQYVRGESWVDYHYEYGPWTDWQPDGPQDAYSTHYMDTEGRVYMIDAPGPWAGALPEAMPHTAWMCLAWSAYQAEPMEFRNELRFGGKTISTNYGNFVVGDWTRHVRIDKAAGEDWVVTYNQ